MFSLPNAFFLPAPPLLAADLPLPDGATNWPLIWVLLLLVSAIVMFVSNKPGMDVVALLMITALPFTGVLTMQETLAGFSDPNIVLIAFLFVLGDGLVRTGIARRLGDWIEKYQLATREKRVRVMPGSDLIGKCLAELHLRDEGVNLLAVERVRERRRSLLRPTRTFCPEVGDILFLDVVLDPEACADLIRKHGVEELPLDPENSYFTDLSQDIGMSEAIIPVDSSLVGRSVGDSRIRSESGLTVIGLRRASEAIKDDFLAEKLQVGDTILVTGFWKDIQRMQRNNKQIVLPDLPAEFEDVLPAANKGPVALGIFEFVVLLMITGVLPNVHAVLIGCLLMGLFGILTMTSAYRAVSWKSLVLIVGMLPFSLALQRTGGIDMAAENILGVIGEGSPRLALAVIFMVTAVLGLFISNTATAVLMAPEALAIAQDLGASPYPFAMVVMLAATSAFMTPVSSPVNTLVVSPGNYRFGDFVRVGVPFTLIVMIVAVIMVPILLPP
jgi:di/tricarboxylate transporter